jgi:hypothetical protein
LEIGGNRACTAPRQLGIIMRKIVYLIDQPLDERNFERFGIQVWLERKWAVEVWDFTPWAHPAVWRSFIDFGKKTKEFAGYFAVYSKTGLAQRLRSAGEVKYFIDLTGETYQTIRAKLALVRAGAIRIVCPGGSVPVPDRGKSGLAARLATLAAKGPNGALKWLSEVFFKRLVAPNIATGLTIVSGEQSIANVKNCAEIIRTHNFDYDIYLGLGMSTASVEKRYAVFIDQDYCFHPEFLFQSNRSVATPEKYFPTVRNGLKLISEALAVDVRIAAHPRATYEQRGLGCFPGFPIEYGRTAELIKECAVVICHDSTAIQFAVLFGKPTIFVTTDELMLAYEGSAIVKIAAELGKSPINLDGKDLQAVDWRREMEIDAARYARYRRKYIKTDGSPEIPMWHIVINQIETAES